MALTLRFLGQASKSAAILEAVTPKRSGLGSKTPKTPRTPKTPGTPLCRSSSFFAEQDVSALPKTPVGLLGRAYATESREAAQGHVIGSGEQASQASCLRAQGLAGGAYPVMLGRLFAGEQERQQTQLQQDGPDFGGISSAIAARDAFRARRVRIEERRTSPDSHERQPVYPMLLGHTQASVPSRRPVAADEEPAAAAHRAFLEKKERIASRFGAFQV